MQSSMRQLLKKIPFLKAFVHAYRKVRFIMEVHFYNKFILPKMLKRIQKKARLSVGFVAWNVPMWKYHSLYKAMEASDRFDPFVILSLSPRKDETTNRLELEDMKKTFSERGYKIYERVQPSDLNFERELLNKVDIVFFVQPYLPCCLEKHLRKFVLCYSDYGFSIARVMNWSHNTFLENICLLHFVPSAKLINEIKKIRGNGGINVFYGGYLYGDELLGWKKDENPNPWKEQHREKKKIVWAPHFSVDPKSVLQLSSFLKVCDSMLELAEEFKDTVQFAFKPHPYLYSKLCEEDFWGKEKADAYYERWKNMDNGQLETGKYEDLFFHSDAIVHDCGSFIVEYLYTKNPCMYLCGDESYFNELTKDALACYYRGTTKEEIRAFIQDVVIGGADTLKGKREAFHQEHLLPPNGKSAAENIIDLLTEKIWGEK